MCVWVCICLLVCLCTMCVHAHWSQTSKYCVEGFHISSLTSRQTYLTTIFTLTSGNHPDIYPVSTVLSPWECLAFLDGFYLEDALISSSISLWFNISLPFNDIRHFGTTSPVGFRHVEGMRNYCLPEISFSPLACGLIHIISFVSPLVRV